MGSGMNAARWNRNTQHQQRQPNQQSRQQRTQQRRPNDHGGFDGSILDKICKFEMANGKIIQGLVSATSKYWYLVNVDGQVIIVNKAYIVSIMPVQSQNNKQSAGTPVGTTVNPYGEEKK